MRGVLNPSPWGSASHSRVEQRRRREQKKNQNLERKIKSSLFSSKTTVDDDVLVNTKYIIREMCDMLY